MTFLKHSKSPTVLRPAAEPQKTKVMQQVEEVAKNWRAEEEKTKRKRREGGGWILVEDGKR